MKKKQIYIFIFSLFTINFIVGQETTNKEIDSIVVKKKLINIDKLSIGVDLYKPIYSSINKQLHEIQMPGDLELMEVQETHPLHM